MRDQAVKFVSALAKSQDGTAPDPLLQMVCDRAWVYLGLPSSATCEVQEIVPSPGGSTGASRLFRLDAEGISRKVFVKTYPPEGTDNRDSAGMRRSYRSEVKALEALGQLFVNETAYRMPLLLDAWDDLNTLIIEGVDAVPVIEAIRTITNKRGMQEGEGRIRHVFTQIGAWLAHLHNVTYAGEGGIDPESVVQLQKRLQQALSERRLLETRVGWRIIECGRRLEKIVEAAHKVLRVPIARCHGDFLLSNLMVDVEGAIWGVDACADRLEPVYIEVTHFLAALRIGRRTILPDRVMRRCERSFLTGYVRGARFRLVGRREGLRICRIYSYLRAVAILLERRRNFKRSAWRQLLEREWVRVKYLRPLETMVLNNARK